MATVVHYPRHRDSPKTVARAWNVPARMGAFRNALYRHCWPTTGVLPTGNPDTIDAGNLNIWSNFDGYISTWDELIVAIPFGYSSVVKYAKPTTTWNGKVLIIKAGHDGDALLSLPYQTVALEALDRGYSVMAVSMPFQIVGNGFTGERTSGLPGGDVDMIGAASNSHNQFDQIEDAGQPTLPYFLEQIPRALNWIIATYAPTDIYMTGLSGGGWGTFWAMAMDQRITKGYGVAGLMPAAIEDGNDHEHFLTRTGRPLNSILGRQEEIFALASYKRRCYAIYNRNDFYYHSHNRSAAINSFVADVQGQLGNGKHGEFNWREMAGGTDGVYSTDNHTYTSACIDFIFTDMET